MPPPSRLRRFGGQGRRGVGNDWVWRVVEWRLRGTVPPAHRASTMGDLAEDYARRCAALGRFNARLWLIREAWSLASAYRTALGIRRRRLMLGGDLRHAWRRLTARPGPAFVCAGLLALGIGLSTAMFSVVDSLLLQPAPFRGGDRLVRQGLFDAEPALMEAWRTSGMFEAVGAGRPSSFQVEADTGKTWPGALITAGMFDLLGVRPLRGQTFAMADGRLVSGDQVVLSEVIWRSVFGGDPTLPGRRIRLDDASVVVVGIMPGSFRFPTPATVAWKPLSPAPGERGGGFTIFGRLKPGVPIAAAEVRIQALARQLARIPDNYGRNSGGAPPLQRVGEPNLSDFTRRALWLLLAGVAVVFVVLCANVSSLLLASLSARRREFGMCTALGASRGRLMREATVEHALIGAVGAAAGVGVAWGVTSAVPGVFLGHTLNLIDIDIRALLTASGLGIASIILTGLIPVWVGTRNDPIESLRGSRQAGTETRTARVLASGLLTAQVALACSLLAGSALLVRSFGNLVEADRGLNSDGVVRVNIGGLDDSFGWGDAMTLATAAIEARFAAWPEIRAVALSREIPPGPTQGGRVHLGPPGAPGDPDAEIPSDGYRVSASFFDFYGIPIVRGRTFEPGDSERDVVVGQRLAGLLWPGLDPLDRTFSVGSLKGAYRVVGVAREIRLPTIDPTLDRPEFYTPLGTSSRTLYVNLRCRASCPTEAGIRAQVEAVHPGLRPRLASPAEDVYSSQLRLPRATAEVGGLFAIVAVLTAAGGLFSVLSYAVGRRRREFGIRAALGASPRQVQRLVFRDGMSVVAIGMAVGIVGGWMVARSLAAFHYGVTAADPATWAGVFGTIAFTSLAAAWRPARQAMRVDPVKLLREE